MAAFAERFAVPAFALPYLSAFVNEAEMRLVLASEDGAVPLALAAALLGVGPAEGERFLEAAFRRGVLNRDEAGGYRVADFHTRLDLMATFEPEYQALPQELRRALDEWALEHYIERVRPNVARLARGERPDSSPGNDSVLLLSELDAVIEQARTIVVVPCDCRQLAGYCDRPREVCLQFDRVAEEKLARGYGRRLSVAEAKHLVRWADRQGLMHTTDLDFGADGPSPICNCCADDCYVFRAAERLGSKGVWPKSRYVARRDEDLCNHCGVCVKRCHFAAFTFADDTLRVGRRKRRRVLYDESACWGCGLCANTCPAGAITMASLSEKVI